jgi:hypothetical protein
MTKLPANLRELLEWLDRNSPLLEAHIVAAGFNHTLDKALMQNFAEMNLCNATVSITARGHDVLSKFPVVRSQSPQGPRGRSSAGRGDVDLTIKGCTPIAGSRTDPPTKVSLMPGLRGRSI